MKKYLFILSSILLLSSCAKEGCTDPTALNYNDEAKKNHGCTYEGSNVVWFDDSTSMIMLNEGISMLIFYLDDEALYVTDPWLYSMEAPACGQGSSGYILMDLGTSPSKSCDYKVTDQNGVEIWSGVLNFSADNCEKVQLVW